MALLSIKRLMKSFVTKMFFFVYILFLVLAYWKNRGVLTALYAYWWALLVVTAHEEDIGDFDD